MQKINYNFYTHFKHLIKTFNTPLPHPMIYYKKQKAYKKQRNSTSWNRFGRLISNSNKTVYYKEQSTKIGKVSELLQIQESHLKVNSIRFSAEANSVMTE